MSTDPVMLGVTTRKITISEYMGKREGERERERQRDRERETETECVSVCACVTHGKK